MPKTGNRHFCEVSNRFDLGHVAGERRRADAARLQMRYSLIEFCLLARGDQDLSSHFTERLGDLQAQAAGSAGDDGLAPGKVEQFPD